MKQSRLSHSPKPTKEGSRIALIPGPRERETDLLNYSILSLPAAIWQIHKEDQTLNLRMYPYEYAFSFLGK